MSSQRRYSQDEIASIFRQAAKDQEIAKDQHSKSDGLTLSELKEIGMETGITPDLIEQAAEAVNKAVPTKAPARLMGLPVSASHEIDLAGPLSDENWNRLVVDMREMFRAHGKLEQIGQFRSWRNGNLQISVEPTEAGHRIRMRTFKGNASAGLLGSLAGGAVVLLILLALVSTGDLDAGGTKMLMLMSMLGFGAFGINFFRLSQWSKERMGQMQALATRAREMAGITTNAVQLESNAAGVLDMEEEENLSEEESTVQARGRSRN
jgi:hypothetical protein